MGALSSFFRNREEAAKANAAADQIYAALRATPSGQLEVAQGMTKEDPTARAIIALQKRHPDVEVVFQSYTVILKLGSVGARQKLSNDALSILDANGYIARNVRPEDLFAQQEQFIRERAHLDPREVERRAEEAHRKDNRG